MNREKRKRRLRLKPEVVKLETRWLMSVGDRESQVARFAANATALLEGDAARGDLDAFARTLATRPKMAADLGLSALSVDLRQHARFARDHGWGATLVSELTAHPRYAAAHHLFAMIAPQAGSPSPTPASSPTTQSAGSGTISGDDDGSTPTQSDDTSSSPPVVVQDPLSTTVGGTLDVTLPNLGLDSTGLTFIITPQPLPANMTFNRQTGELVFAPDPGQVGDLRLLGCGLQRLGVGHGRRADHRHRSRLCPPPRSRARSSTRAATPWPTCRFRLTAPRLRPTRPATSR